jgi:tRNA-binding protein
MDPLEALETLDLRVGRILRAEPNTRARKPSYKLWIDFGPLGEKTYIAGFQSEVLVLGVPDASGETVVLAVEREVPVGGTVY